MNTHSTEPFLIGIVLILTAAAGFFLVRKSGNNATQNAEKLLTGLLGAFMLLGGTAKFFEPLIYMYANQIALSGLSFPVLSKWAGQLGEISVGLTLLTLFAAARKLPPVISEKAFYIANLLITVIMLVAIYVHLHPDVPAHMGTKPPLLTVFILLLAGLNMYLHRKNQHTTTNSKFDPSVHLKKCWLNPKRVKNDKFDLPAFYK